MGHLGTIKIQQRHPFGKSFFVVFILSIFYFPSQAAIQINDYGVRPFKSGDTAMVFYANASHTGGEDGNPIAARLKMERCCLETSNKESVCDAMKLISGLAVILHPKASFILKMYFVNFDLYDRAGTCTLTVATMPVGMGSSSIDEQHWQRGQELTIAFKNNLAKPSIIRKLMTSIGWNSNQGYRVCNTGSETALQKCSNEDCQLRYAGARSFHNKKTDQCEPTPDCDVNQNTMLSPMTGKCEAIKDIAHIRRPFSRQKKSSVEDTSKPPEGIDSDTQVHEEEKAVERAIVEGPSSNEAVKTAPISGVESPKPSITCVNGDHVTGSDGQSTCTCHEGWRSLTAYEIEEHKGAAMGTDGGAGNKLCDIPTLDSKKRGLLLLVFLIVSILTPIVALIICVYRQRKEDEEKQRLSKAITDHGTSGDSEEEESSGKTSDFRPTSDDTDTEAIISEITNRREPKPRRLENDAKQKSTASLPKVKSSHASVGRVKPKPSKVGTSSSKSTTKVASMTPSTDELLTMKEVEKSGAHIPIAPVPSMTRTPLVHVHSSINMNQRAPVTQTHTKTIVSTCSSEEMTEKKKEEWAQYISSVSKPDFCSILLSSDEEEYHISTDKIKGTQSSVEFKYARSPNPQDGSNTSGAIKVHSLPVMKVSTQETVQASPDLLMKKSFERMQPQERVRKQEAYSLLSSFSNSRLSAGIASNTSNNDRYNSNKQPTNTQSSHSIWSNVASENAAAPEPEVASTASSYGDVRSKSIYGNMESDEDSDAALDKIASSDKLKKQTVAELFEHNQRLYGFPQKRSQPQLHEGRVNNNGPNPQPLINVLQMECEAVPSDAYLTSDSSTLTSPVQSVLKFWNQKETHPTANISKSNVNCNPSRWINRAPNTADNYDSSGQGNALGGDNSSSRVTTSQVSSTNLLSPDTRSAYQIKSSLEHSLKASRSRSASNIFPF